MHTLVPTVDDSLFDRYNHLRARDRIGMTPIRQGMDSEFDAKSLDSRKLNLEQNMPHLLRILLKQWPVWSPILLGVMCIVSATILHRPIVILNRLVAERIAIGKPRHRRSAPATWFSESVPEKPAEVPAHFWMRAAIVVCGAGIVLWRVCSMLSQ